MLDFATCALTLGLYCKLKYYFVAQNTKNCEIFSGRIIHQPTIGKAHTVFFTPSGATCEGVSYVTYIPPGGGCAGQQGKVPTQCSDGRIVDGTWTASSCKTGFGHATDNLGNEYQFTFGLSAQEAVKKVNELRINLGCPVVDVKGAEMSVSGKVLRIK